MANISYPTDGNDICFLLEDDSFWFQERNKIIGWFVKKYAKDGIFADVGGGNGYVTRYLQSLYPRLDCILVEPGVKGCENARTRGVQKVYTKELSALTEFSHLDNIGIFDVIEHIEDDSRFLKEIHEKLAPGGKLFITTPAYGFLWSAEDAEGGHFRRYTRSELIRKAKKIGFTVEGASYFFIFLIPVIFLIRSLPWLLGIKHEQNSVGDHKKTFAAQMIQFVLSIEFQLLRLFSRFPLGASLIVCLRK